MEKNRTTARHITLLLLLIAAGALACTGPGDTRADPTAAPPREPTLAAPAATAPPTASAAPVATADPTATRRPPVTATPLSTAAPPTRQARRADFIVALPSPTSPPAVTPTTTLARPAAFDASAASPLPTPAGACPYQARFVADVTVPDGTTLEPGLPFSKTWRLENSGPCAWEAGVGLAFAGGAPLGGPASITVSPTVPGRAVDLSLPLVAPGEPGAYTGHWRLRTPAGQPFGDELFVQIVVPSPPGAEDPPATPTVAAAPPPVSHAALPRWALLNYFAWYDGASWDGCNISAGDRPTQPYNSDDPAAIGRHIQMARDAGADGFTLQWFAPGERTDANLQTLLDLSQGSEFHSSVVFLRHIWPGGPITQASVAEAMRYLLERYGGHPNFLTLEGKPVIFVTDVYRVPRAAGQTPQQAWASIRAQADPAGNSIWIAEGLDPSYLAVFDGLWVYKITHAAYPNAYLKAAAWGGQVRRWEAQTGQRKLWIGTISPGWDDLRAGCRADVRVPSQAHRVDRADGAFYRATFDAALGSNPDWLWVNSFNEWVEGTYVEPSAAYGDLYLQLTRELIAGFKSPR